MKAVILAGGLGSRLSEETSVRPKPMVEIGGKPMLWHIMKIYSAHGINDFVVCLGYKGKDEAGSTHCILVLRIVGRAQFRRFREYRGSFPRQDSFILGYETLALTKDHHRLGCTRK